MACAAKGIVDAWDITISKARTVAFDLSLALDCRIYQLIAKGIDLLLDVDCCL